MTATLDWHHYTQFEADGRALGLVVLFTVVLMAAGALATALAASPDAAPTAASGSTAQQAATGAGGSVLIVIEAVALLGLLALMRRTPEWLQPVIRRTIVVAFWAGVAIYAAMLAGPLAGLATAALAYFGVHAIDALGGYWIVNDALAVGIAIVGAAVIGYEFGPVVVGVALLVLTAYDHVFANKRTWMHSLARMTVRWRVPALIVVPTRWRLPWGDLADFSTDDEDDPIGFAIGTGDLAIPGTFVAGVLVHGGAFPAAVAGAGVLVACLRLSWVSQNSGGAAGLPALTAGALGGWVLAAGVGVVA